MDFFEPFDELVDIRYGRRKRQHFHMRREQYYRFFPDRTSFYVGKIMYFIENKPFPVTELFGIDQNRIAEYFGGHD
jgi:CMP-N-acetylneuraminic acid synthetase